jgi:pilus assembly protein Flp/PilA
VKPVKTLLAFLKDEEGASAVEYGILIAAIAAVIVVLAFAIGGKIQTAFQTVSDALK